LRYILLLWMLCPLTYAISCPTAQTKDEAALIQNEQTWARALEKQDIDALICLLADEFEDVGITGSLSNRSDIVGRAQNHPGVHNELSELHAHIYGDVGYIRGVATNAGLAQRAGTLGRPPTKVRFTDVYVYRDGRWQCVAAHETAFPRTIIR
jgi:ketosteroid isomerase-like protein